MSNWIIAFLVAIAATTWLYSALMRRTGNNTKSSLVAAGIAGVLLFLLMLIVLGFVFSK